MLQGEVEAIPCGLGVTFLFVATTRYFMRKAPCCILIFRWGQGLGAPLRNKDGPPRRPLCAADPLLSASGLYGRYLPVTGHWSIPREDISRVLNGRSGKRQIMIRRALEHRMELRENKTGAVWLGRPLDGLRFGQNLIRFSSALIRAETELGMGLDSVALTRSKALVYNGLCVP
jgi:hypothetical protein